MASLYLCPTPIGNLEDMTFRVLNTLKNVDYICAEDTRHSLKLLRHFDIEKTLISYHEHNKYEKLDYIINLIDSGSDIALITDAGTPAISDPGEVLVKECIKLGIKVVPLTGAVALITALIASGISTRSFIFEGFLPQEKKLMKKVLNRNIKETRTIIFYEAPHRLTKTLKIMLDNFGNRKITLCRELTKIHEEFIYTNLEEAINLFNNEKPKGEFVLVIEGLKEEELEKEELMRFNNISITEHMNTYMMEGYSEKDAMKMVAKDRKVSKREIYQEVKGKKDE